MVNFISMNACTFENERKGRGWRNTRSGEESLEMFGVKGVVNEFGLGED
jgi:hypothetical protein